MVKLVDTQVLGTCAYGVGVQVPPGAPTIKQNGYTKDCGHLKHNRNDRTYNRTDYI